MIDTLSHSLGWKWVERELIQRQMMYSDRLRTGKVEDIGDIKAWRLALGEVELFQNLFRLFIADKKRILDERKRLVEE